MADPVGLPSLQHDYSPADFADIDNGRVEMSTFPVSVNEPEVTFVNYTTVVNNTFQAHAKEVLNKTQSTLDISTDWKVSFRSFILNQMKELLEFAAKPLKEHPTMGPVVILMQKFGYSTRYDTLQSIRDIPLDVSGVNIKTFIEEGLKQFPHTLEGFQSQSFYLLNLYRDAGREILRGNTILQSRLAMFEKIQKSISVFTDIPIKNEESTALALATEAYLKRVFRDNDIESVYMSQIEAYRKFFFLRDIVHMRGMANTIESTPICNICFDGPIEFAVIPCGHTYCNTCTNKNFQICYICRAIVKQRVKLFLV